MKLADSVTIGAKACGFKASVSPLSATIPRHIL